MLERIKPNTENRKAENPNDKIEGRNIFLHSQGEFPKKVLIMLDDGKELEYMIRKTRKGKYLLN
jgi:hemin uptake protein HemP